MSDNNALEITKIMGKKAHCFAEEWMKHHNRPETETAIMSITNIPLRWRLQRVWEKRSIVLPKSVYETHPNRPETDTALLSDNKHSNALKITKIMGKKAHCFIEESG